MHGHQSRYRVTGQANKYATGQTTAGKGFARFNRQLPETDFTKLGENVFGVIRFTHRYTARGNDHIGQTVGLNKRLS